MAKAQPVFQKGGVITICNTVSSSPHTPEALDAFDALFQQASGAPDMTPDEINAEIAAVRAARKAVKQ